MFSNHFGQQKRGNRCNHESHCCKAQWVREQRSVAALASWKSRKESSNSFPEIDRQAGDCPQLNHNRIHLPIAAGEVDMQQRFAEAQMCRRANGKKLCQTLDNSQQHGQEVVAQMNSSDCLPAWRVAPGRILRISYASMRRR